MSNAIFSIDFENNPHRMNIFQNYVRSLDGKLRGNVIPMIGCYNGSREHSFICCEDDFNDFFRDSVFLEGQESVLWVATGNKMEATLEYLPGSKSAPPGTVTSYGCMHEVCEAEAMQSPSWTYRADMATYWIAKVGNPDNSYQRSVAAYAVPAENALAAE